MIKPFLLIGLLYCFVGCAYTVAGQNKATHDLIVEKTRSIELDNQIKTEQLKQMQLQTANLQAKSAE